MYFAPKSMSDGALPEDVLRKDKTECLKFDECGLGKKAVYLGLFGVSRVRYIPLTQVQRVFKRLMVSKGFFEQNKLFGVLPYLVVRYDGGKEKAYRFTREEDVDAMLDAFRSGTDIPVGKA